MIESGLKKESKFRKRELSSEDYYGSEGLEANEGTANQLLGNSELLKLKTNDPMKLSLKPAKPNHSIDSR
jgi:hypothetical protein